jgi:hypothetical protein
MTAFLEFEGSGPAVHEKQAAVNVTAAPVTEAEIPKVNGVKPTEPMVNGAHTNGVQDAHQETAQDPFKLASEYGYTPKKLKVFTIGAGFSGLLMAHKFQHRFPEMQEFIDHTLFEAHSEVGGTWLVNNYPGVQCDVPAHIYACKFYPVWFREPIKSDADCLFQSPSTQIQIGLDSTRAVQISLSTSRRQSRSGTWTATCN